jgi:two-component system, NtrC family, nitrogen regulation sensor histidine kinase GlnL
LGQQTQKPGVQERAAIQIAGGLPIPVLLVGPGQEILFVNPAAEQFFGMGMGLLVRHGLSDIVPFSSPIIQLMGQARERNASVGERDMDLSTPKHGERIADVIVTPVAEPEGAVLVTLQERSLAQRLDRQLLHRGAVRSLHGMAAVLAHEIKNPLAGIRGAAQLLEEAVPPSERSATHAHSRARL